MRAPPGIVDEGSVIEKSDDFAPLVNDPNDDDNFVCESVDSVQGLQEFAPDTPAEQELVAVLPRNVTLRMALVTRGRPSCGLPSASSCDEECSLFLARPFRNARNWRWKKLLGAIVAGNLVMFLPIGACHQCHVGEKTSRCPSPASPALRGPPTRDHGRCGWMTADGVVRGIVSGGVLWLSSTTPARLSSGCECIAHALQGLCELNPRTTNI